MSKILVIDDEESVRMLLRAVLEEDGHEVREATDGRTGIALYRQERADLVIADILMPDLNGLDMIVELTREFLDVKVIAITGVYGEPDLLKRARLLGARHTFYKPFSPEELLKVVRYELTH
ncbi:MAG TPA: response regulator [Nitrospira sp.]|nr:response regulator [Nitrospira sp.]